MTKTFFTVAALVIAVARAASATEIATVVDTPCPFGDCTAHLALGYLGAFSIPTGTVFDGVEFGGISGLDFDPASGRYVAISHDRSEKAPARFYDLDIDVDTDGLKGVSVARTTVLRDRDGKPFAAKGVDPEAIRVTAGGVYWSSEGDAKAGVSPFLRVNDRDGAFLREFDLPDGFAPTADRSSGIRNNNAFESVTVLPSGDVIVGLEAALHQDGPAASLTTGSLARMIRYDAKTGKAKAQYVYPVSPIPQAPDKSGGWNDNGVPEMLALDEHRLLVLERGFAEGLGSSIKLFMIDLDGATDVSDIAALAKTDAGIVPVRKSQLLDLRGIGLEPDNIEAMTFAKAKDGTDLLILAADNNFSAEQKNQFYAFKVLARPQ
ncbi:esterase-like activity of phytase family protein [Rhizobium halophytocola]|uniref:Phytase-like domain-containing protein n=1 Tax=Rhizobium halophytocola TaxID=735519 RepID=A0ABS4DWA9_9HYPH|nr:esterase-like activity of phytase family protein [Rhizobium halophytocola]MBP1849984.1 hypothetical protein [Rhizobium halophytocola]